ncbi:MAG: hypothetical protein JKY75_10925 [Erythrobacter sp.]|jgi:hypothetical protein|nr:hypothetical protein [Erythrobacter sp.]
MNNGMLMLIAGLGLLWMLSRKPAAAAPWVGGSQPAQQTAAYEIGF